MKNKINCPKCGFEFDVDEVLEHQAEEKIREELSKGFEKEKKIIEEETIRKTKEQNEAEINQLREDNEKKSKENLELKKKELEILKKERGLKEKEETMKIEIEKDLLLKADGREKEIREQESAKNDMKVKELEKQLADQKKLSDEMKRKLEQGSMQLQGEVQELALEDILKSTFPIDDVGEVPKGVSGADVVQKVKNALGQYCGTIIWESKRTKSWGQSWIPKLKDDQRSIKAEIAIILTSVLPSGIENFGIVENVWVTDYKSFIGLTTALRLSLIELEKTKKSFVGKNEKMDILYKYIFGTEFSKRIEAIVDNFRNMKTDLDKEKTAMEKIWAKREKQIQNVLSTTAGMYGDLEGIVGKSIPEIKNLELKSLTEGETE